MKRWGAEGQEAPKARPPTWPPPALQRGSARAAERNRVAEVRAWYWFIVQAYYLVPLAMQLFWAAFNAVRAEMGLPPVMLSSPGGWSAAAETGPAACSAQHAGRNTASGRLCCLLLLLPCNFCCGARSRARLALTAIALPALQNLPWRHLFPQSRSALRQLLCSGLPGCMRQHS